jgi:hypothetical protein
LLFLLSWLSALGAVALASLAGCGGARVKPHGPPPEYEEPELAQPAFAIDAGAD